MAKEKRRWLHKPLAPEKDILLIGAETKVQLYNGVIARRARKPWYASALKENPMSSPDYVQMYVIREGDRVWGDPKNEPNAIEITVKRVSARGGGTIDKIITPF